MKLLAICGSPHKGNTYSLLKSVEDNISNIDYKLLMLNESNLEMCRGCYTCVLKGEQKCPIKDDRDMILKEISAADGIVFASPVHVNHITALMKHFIDRLGYIAHRPCFYGKYAMVMAICGGFGADKANEYMNGIFGFMLFHPSNYKFRQSQKRKRNTIMKKQLTPLTHLLPESKKDREIHQHQQ